MPGKERQTTITTYTGKRFDPVHPDPDLIDIRDIAHALSLICRGNGQVRTFYSVGQHCIACAREAETRGYPPRLALACLLHDAGECYLSDVPSPFKRVLPDYRAYENRLLELIYRRYLGSPLSDKEQSDLDGIDHAMLDRDLACLLGETQAGKPDLLTRPDYTVRPFERVEQEFLTLFRRLAGAVRETGKGEPAHTESRYVHEADREKGEGRA